MNDKQIQETMTAIEEIVEAKKEYRLVVEPSPIMLSKTVSKMMNDGWDLYGDHSAHVVARGMESQYRQAMVRGV